MALGLGLGLSKYQPLLGGGDPLAGIPFDLRLQTHRGDNVPFGLYQDVACTTPALLDGDPVAAWRDELSGSLQTFIQADTQKQPMLLFDGSLPRLYFDGVDDFLEKSSPGSLATEYRSFSKHQMGGTNNETAYYNGVNIFGGNGWGPFTNPDPGPGPNRTWGSGGAVVLYERDGSATTDEELWTVKFESAALTLRINSAPTSIESVGNMIQATTKMTVGAMGAGLFLLSGTLTCILLNSTQPFVLAETELIENYLLTL